MPKSRLIAAIALAALGGCTHYGTSRVEQGESAPTGLYFVHVPVDARILVDGVDKGAAGAFTEAKKDILHISSGTHRVMITSGGQTIYDKPVYVGSGDRVRVAVQ